MSNDLESLVNEYAEARERFDAAIAKNGKNLVMALAKPVFAAAEAAGLKPLCIGWTQYTPSFNDGDPCTFCSRDAELVTQNVVDEFVAEDLEEEDVELDDHGIPESFRFGEGYVDWSKYPEVAKALHKFNTVVSDEVKQRLFSEYGAKVLVKPTEIVEEEYDCGY